MRPALITLWLFMALTIVTFVQVISELTKRIDQIEQKTEFLEDHKHDPLRQELLEEEYKGD